MTQSEATGQATTAAGPATVFVAGPFYKLVDPAVGRMSDQHRNRVERLIDHFEARGARVHNAHKREKWGAEFLEADEFTRLDHDEIAASDVVVAVPGPPASLGTHIELGWASATGKPIVLLLERGEEYALMVYGLRHLTPVAVVETVDGLVDLDALDAAVAEVLGAAG